MVSCHFVFSIIIFVFTVQKSVNTLAGTEWDMIVSHICCFLSGEVGCTMGASAGHSGRTGCLKLTALTVETKISQVRRSIHSSYFLD